MIKVVPRPEYLGFTADVRIPGAAFLAICPTPTNDQFKKKDFWRRAGRELHAAYEGICAYTAMYYLPNHSSIDHFLPKGLHPHLAYEWTNYRLANGKINTTKGEQVGILDPFLVEDSWFHLDIPTCMLKSNPDLDRPLRVQINRTISSLGLNQDENYVGERCNVLMLYAGGEISLNFLSRRYPLLAKEVQRQGLDLAALRLRFSM